MNMLKPSVAIVSQHDGVVLVDRYGSAPAVRLGGQHVATIMALQPGNGDKTAVVEGPENSALLATLEHYGFLLGSEADPNVARANRAGTVSLPNPDRLARWLVWPFQQIPVALLVVLLCTLLLAAVTQLTLLSLHPVRLTPPANPIVLAGFYLLTILAHEMTHAMVMRYHNLPISQFAIRLKGVVFPSPFMASRCTPLLTRPWARASVPAAGPMWDLLAAGSLAAYLLWAPQAWTYLADSDVLWMLIIQITILVMNLTPFRQSDFYLMTKHLLTNPQGITSAGFNRFITIYKLVYGSLVLIVFPLFIWINWFN